MNVKAMSIRGPFLTVPFRGFGKSILPGKRTLTLVTVSALLFLVGLVCMWKIKKAIWASFNISYYVIMAFLVCMQ